MTDKATVEIPSAIEGKVTEFHAKEGETVHVDQLMLSFDGAGAGNVAGAGKPAAAPATSSHAPAAASAQKSAAPAAAPQAPAKAGSLASSAPAAYSSNGSADTSISGRVLAAPSTRRFAREQGVDLTRVQPTGPNGRVMREDVEKSGHGGTTTATRAYPQGGEERVPFRGLRKKIAEKMRLSKDHAAHFTYVEEADATELVKLRAAAKEIGAASGVKVTYLPFLMKAMVACLRKYPILNSSLDEAAGELVYKHYFNIGLSIQTDDGLTAPVVKNVEHKTIMEIAKEIQDLVDRARHKKLTNDDFAGSTITLTNAGSIGGLFATPIINYPEVAILGFNKIFRKPVAIKRGGAEVVEIRDWTYFSISLDHRVVDGAVGAEFMKMFITYIENPALLMLEG
jgi:pyruvate dehydrogenase E2 component (dihydrolipoamide acetyltransferase)